MKKLCLHAAIVFVLAGFLSFRAWTSARAEELTCPTHTPVTIDIKPGSTPNKINLSSNGLVPVAVLTTQEFDASHFVPEMAHLSDSNAAMTGMCAGASALRWKLEDENKDGKLDLVFFFNKSDLDFTLNTTNATFMAHGAYDSAILHIIGSDSVQVKP